MPFSEDRYSLFVKYLLIYSSALAETKGKLSYCSTSVGYCDLGVCYWIYKAKKSCTPIIPSQMETVHARLCMNISRRHKWVVWANGFDPMVATPAALTLLSQPTSWPHGEFPMTHPPRKGSFDADQGSWPSLIYRNWLEARQETQARL